MNSHLFSDYLGDSLSTPIFLLCEMERMSPKCSQLKKKKLQWDFSWRKLKYTYYIFYINYFSHLNAPKDHIDKAEGEENIHLEKEGP